jgi:hypothetical protein
MVTVFWDVMKTLKMGAAPSSKTSVNIYQTEWHHISEDSNLQDRWLFY